jgi:hypothetical protein
MPLAEIEPAIPAGERPQTLLRPLGHWVLLSKQQVLEILSYRGVAKVWTTREREKKEEGGGGGVVKGTSYTQALWGGEDRASLC